MATEADTAEITAEITEADETGRADVYNTWDSAVIILTGCGNDCDELSTRIAQLLYYKTLEAGIYDVRLLEEEDSVPDLPALSDETVPSSSEASVVSETVRHNDSNDVDVDVDVDVVDAPATDKAVADSQEAAEIAVSFIIREIFHQYIFVVPSALHNDHNDSFVTVMEKNETMRELANKPLYLVNPHKNVDATGIMRGDGKRIVVKAGSRISTKNRLPNQKGQGSSASLRQKLIDDGMVIDGQFVADYEFSSTSAAASVILGQSASGMISWKDENGIKLEALLRMSVLGNS